MAEAPPREEMDLLAGEYTLGVLDAEARREVAGLIDSNGTMRFLADEWQGRLAPLNGAYVATDAPDVWPALDRQLFAPRRRRNRLFWLLAAGLVVALVVKVAVWVRVLG